MSYVYDNDEFSRYYDTFVANHVPDHIFWTKAVKNIYSDIIRRTFISTDNSCTTIVELGCGTGENLIYFRNYFQNKNIKFIGIDHSRAMLRQAKKKLINQSNDQIEFLDGSLTNFADCLETKKIDCILLPGGTFHHLITDNARLEFLNNIQKTLRSETGLFGIYLLPDSLIRIESVDNSNSQDRFKLISVESIQHNDNEWICTQTFEFDVPPKTELSWQLRTCSISNLIDLFISNNFEVMFCCLNGSELLPYNENILLSWTNSSTPIIIIFRAVKNRN